MAIGDSWTFEKAASSIDLRFLNKIEGFWFFAKERLMKYRGVDPARFPFYLKELEFRDN
jgi:transposase-like protein